MVATLNHAPTVLNILLASYGKIWQKNFDGCLYELSSTNVCLSWLSILSLKSWNFFLSNAAFVLKEMKA